MTALPTHADFDELAKAVAVTQDDLKTVQLEGRDTRLALKNLVELLLRSVPEETEDPELSEVRSGLSALLRVLT